MAQPFDAAQDLRDAPRTGARLRPKDAATLILVRRDGGEPRVLMGRRAEGHVFMASKWVFPGGRVDRADYRAPAATELKPEVAAALAPANASKARALGLAAIRETFEETGLLLAREAPSRPAAGPWRPFLAQGALPDLGALDYVARAVTPPGRARRFDARFFTADAEGLLHLDHQPGVEKELDEVAWIALSDTKALDLPQITRFILGEIVDRMDEVRNRGTVDSARRPPLVRMVRGRHVIER
ncbi:MAG TPA: NUDIX domain-containing protein [Caulobacteraceae bacterium]|jgi:8-oxo-dGTP pyrophosphatase MutT (NUDIX family)